MPNRYQQRPGILRPEYEEEKFQRFAKALKLEQLSVVTWAQRFQVSLSTIGKWKRRIKEQDLQAAAQLKQPSQPEQH